MTSKKTLVLGASPNPERYAHRAVLKLHQYGHEVIPVGARSGQIGDFAIITERPTAMDDLDTITLYLGPDRQRDFYDYIVEMRPKRLIFNPGTENPELAHLARTQGIEPVEGCTLVMLSIGNY